jgi:tripartite-type tricarboxylate transporter receptor subunit TctC
MRAWPLALIAIALGVLPARAQANAADYPSRTVTIVAPAAPGGLYSLFARLIGAKLEQRFGKPVMVENRPGASSVVGALSVARATADGYLLMTATSSTMATNVSLFKNLPYDPAERAPMCRRRPHAPGRVRCPRDRQRMRPGGVLVRFDSEQF